jgi:hypothetical protein
MMENVIELLANVVTITGGFSAFGYATYRLLKRVRITIDPDQDL